MLTSVEYIGIDLAFQRLNPTSSRLARAIAIKSSPKCHVEQRSPTSAGYGVALTCRVSNVWLLVVEALPVESWFAMETQAMEPGDRHIFTEF
ncbi:hypothetical protein ACQ4M4_11030 [Leptolyngbya sp. AN02str]|uniref:hypothetical protein n=1 Tax=Leptolyngbya sp. AN02str TaxID=3423363 RepID=UPI003D321856